MTFDRGSKLESLSENLIKNIAENVPSQQKITDSIRHSAFWSVKSGIWLTFKSYITTLKKERGREGYILSDLVFNYWKKSNGTWKLNKSWFLRHLETRYVVVELRIFNQKWMVKCSSPKKKLIFEIRNLLTMNVGTVKPE